MKTILLFATLFFCLSTYSQSPWLLKDINNTSITNQLSDGTYIGSASSTLNSASASSLTPDQGPGRMYPVNGIALFFANDARGKRGLWRTDGTTGNTIN